MLRLHVPDQLGGERRSRFHMRALNHPLRLLANFYGPLAGSLHVKGTFWSLLTQSNARNNTFQCSNLSKEKQALKRVLRSPRCQLGRKYPRPQTVLGRRPQVKSLVTESVAVPTHFHYLYLAPTRYVHKRMPVVGIDEESLPEHADKESESPHKLVLLVIALVIFHIGAFVSSKHIISFWLMRHEYSPIICFNHKHVF